MVKRYILSADDVVDSLDSTDTSIPLSANQGRVLNVTKQDVVQMQTLPTASTTYAGKIVQYIGNTTSSYVNGYYYKCVLDKSVVPNVYKWAPKDVQAGGSNPEWGTITGELSSQSDLQTALDAKQTTANIVTSFQATPDDTHYPSEKLVKDTVDTKIGATETATLTNKTIDADSNTLSNIETDNLKSTSISTSIPTSGAVDTKLATEKAVAEKSFVTKSISGATTLDDLFTQAGIAFGNTSIIAYATGITSGVFPNSQTEGYVYLHYRNSDFRKVVFQPYGSSSMFVKSKISNTWESDWTEVGSGATWGSITGTLSSQTDLQTALNGKQDTLPTTSTGGQVLTSTTTAGVMEWKAVGGVLSNSVGEILQYVGALPAGTLDCDGSAVSKTTYAELYSAIGYGATSAWTASTAYAVGQYVTNDSKLYRCTTAHTSGSSFDSSKWSEDTENFRLPDLRNKYVKGWGDKSKFAIQNAGLPNITGQIIAEAYSWSGAFKSSSTYSSWGCANAGSSLKETTLRIKASDSNSIYSDDNDTVDVDAVVVKFAIVYTRTLGTTTMPDNTTLHNDANGNMAVVYQEMFDMCHPINSVWVQYTANDNPNTLFNVTGKYASTWTDISSTYDGRYCRVDSSNNAGTQVSAGLPMPSATFTGTMQTTESVDGHTHGRGTMEIEGQVTITARSSDTNGGVAIGSASGALGAGTATMSRTLGASSSGDSMVSSVALKASDGWTGVTGSSGGHNHEYTPVGTVAITPDSIYKSDSNTVTPLTSTVKLWQRTA